MTPIQTLYLPFIQEGIDSDFIMDLFYCKEIATISCVHILPQTREAFIIIHSWHDTDVAYDFILRLRNSLFGALVYYSEGQAFQVYASMLTNINDIKVKDTYVNWLLCDDNDVTSITTTPTPTTPTPTTPTPTTPTYTTNSLGKLLLDNLASHREWRDIELALYHTLAFQNLQLGLAIY